MNKSELIELVAARHDISKVRAAALVNGVFGTITDTLANGEKVVISNFGTFSLSHRRGFEGHNPQTGGTMQVPKRCIPLFKAGKALKNRLNENST